MRELGGSEVIMECSWPFACHAARVGASLEVVSWLIFAFAAPAVVGAGMVIAGLRGSREHRPSYTDFIVLVVLFNASVGTGMIGKQHPFAALGRGEESSDASDVVSGPSPMLWVVGVRGVSGTLCTYPFPSRATLPPPPQRQCTRLRNGLGSLNGQSKRHANLRKRNYANSMRDVTVDDHPWESLEVAFNDNADDPASKAGLTLRRTPIPPSSIALLPVVSSDLHDFKPNTNDVKKPRTTKHPVSPSHAQPQNKTHQLTVNTESAAPPNLQHRTRKRARPNTTKTTAYRRQRLDDDDGGEEIDGHWNLGINATTALSSFSRLIWDRG
ncbi:hypothetical protein DFP72DRAFT_844687 [Ephemerocybe angulata]|uniref:Uncharacterized protein n=1 Tax=Ephemerocybe angulata TaxID=980116 RepID=A0A8H6I6R8_9AGAR|nr:hypothetical protein DFP72DRAFT_844687 [Tulosesus angulatus]